MNIKSFHTFVQEAFESTMLSEIGDASAKPYRLRYDKFSLDYRVSKFVVKNEDFDADDPERNWEEIDMKITSSLDDMVMMTISFGRDNFGRFERNQTLDIGLKYFLRIRSTVLQHVLQHIEDYNKAGRDVPLEGLKFISVVIKNRQDVKKQRRKLYKAYIEKNIRKIAPRAKVYVHSDDIFVPFNLPSGFLM